MDFQEPLENIVWVNYDNKYDLASTFLRFQEYYESPVFRGKIFTFEEYKKWYIENSPKGKKTGEFTYYDDWNGFNIPSEILKPFYDGNFDPLSKREKDLLECFEDRTNKGLFYIIGTYDKKNIGTLKHEIAHGLYYTCPEYKTAVLEILDDSPKRERDKIRDLLTTSHGYHPSVSDDETHAYILTNLLYLHENAIEVSTLQDVAIRLEDNFKQYIMKNLRNKQSIGFQKRVRRYLSAIHQRIISLIPTKNV